MKHIIQLLLTCLLAVLLVLLLKENHISLAIFTETKRIDIRLNFMILIIVVFLLVVFFLKPLWLLLKKIWRK